MPAPRRPYYLGNPAHLGRQFRQGPRPASQPDRPANRRVERLAGPPGDVPTDHRAALAGERSHGRRRFGPPPLPVLLMLLSLLLTGGCADVVYNVPPSSPSLLDLVSVSYTAADALDLTLATYGIKDMPMLVASFVNRDDLEETSPLGRTLSEQMGSRLAQHGYPVVDVRLRTATLLVRGPRAARPVEETDLLGQAMPGAGQGNTRDAAPGEFALSRQLDALNRQYGAHSILVGTYSVVQRSVYVSARVLRCTDGVILAADDFSLPFQPGLLSPGSGRTAPPPPIVPSVRTTF